MIESNDVNPIIKASRIANEMRLDGYSNLMNKYGTTKDNSMYYQYSSEPFVDDLTLTQMYVDNGLFARIIDRPSEESVKHGFDTKYDDEHIETIINDRLDELDFEYNFGMAEKMARLYGGSLLVMVTNDGRGLDEPLDLNHFQSIEELRVFDRSVVQPDYFSMYNYRYGVRDGSLISQFGEPDFFDVYSVYGEFRVHRSRCLVFHNGKMPEKVMNEQYRYWGIPELLRIRRAMRECMTSHTDGVKLMERSVQAIYKMKNLATMLGTDQGEDKVLQRLNVIDMARGILNSIAIDTDGEDYDFKNFSTTGVSDIINATCNMLAAVSSIPQTILFGRSPAGENSTGESDFENYYNLVENIQKQNIKKNSKTLIDLIIKQAMIEGDIEKEPKYKLSFAPLWSLSDVEKAQIDATKASTAATKASTAATYVSLQALDPSEVRAALKMDGELGYDINDDKDGFGQLNLPADTFDYQTNGNSYEATPEEIELAQAIDMESQMRGNDNETPNTSKDDSEEENNLTDEEIIMAHALNGTDETNLPTANEMILANEMYRVDNGDSRKASTVPYISIPLNKKITRKRATNNTKCGIIKVSEITNTDGGPGSGYIGHPGRPDQRGGSISRAESKAIKESQASLPSNSANTTRKKNVNSYIENSVRFPLKDLQKAIENQTVSIKIDRRKQLVHDKNSNVFKSNCSKGIFKSYLYPGIDAQKIADMYKTGISFSQPDKSGIRTVVNCDYDIGCCVDKKTGKGTPTNRATIHFSRTGTHVVPAMRSKGVRGKNVTKRKAKTDV